jgi:hypothetical protein
MAVRLGTADVFHVLAPSFLAFLSRYFIYVSTHGFIVALH